MSGDVLAIDPAGWDSRVVLLDRAGAEAVTARIVGTVETIANRLTVLHNDLVDAYYGRAHVALGYPGTVDGWDAYCREKLGALRAIRLPADLREDLVADLRAAELSTRAIGSLVGYSEGQVRIDLRKRGVAAPETVRGADGRTYAGAQAAPAKPRPTRVARVIAALAAAGPDGATARELGRKLREVPDVGAVLSEQHKRGTVARLCVDLDAGTRSGFAVYVALEHVAGRPVEPPGRRNLRRG